MFLSAAAVSPSMKAGSYTVLHIPAAAVHVAYNPVSAPAHILVRAYRKHCTAAAAAGHTPRCCSTACSGRMAVVAAAGSPGSYEAHQRGT
jgi:hypothetical protein